MKSALILNQSFLAGVVSAVTSTPTAETALPCVNLFNGMRHNVCRIKPSSGALTITVTLTSTLSIAAVGLGGIKSSVAATARCVIKNASSETVYDSATGAVYSSAAQFDLPWFSRTMFWIINSTVTAKTIEITFNDTLAAVDISNIVFGPDFSPSLNPEWGVSWNWQDTSIQQRTAGGSLLANPSYGFRKVQLAWQNLPDTDHDKFAAMLQAQGQSMMLSIFPKQSTRREADMQMIGRLVSADGINLSNFNINSLASVIIEEI